VCVSSLQLQSLFMSQVSNNIENPEKSDNLKVDDSDENLLNSILNMIPNLIPEFENDHVKVDDQSLPHDYDEILSEQSSSSSSSSSDDSLPPNSSFSSFDTDANVDVDVDSSSSDDSSSTFIKSEYGLLFNQEDLDVLVEYHKQKNILESLFEDRVFQRSFSDFKLVFQLKNQNVISSPPPPVQSFKPMTPPPSISGLGGKVSIPPSKFISTPTGRSFSPPPLSIKGGNSFLDRIRKSPPKDNIPRSPFGPPSSSSQESNFKRTPFIKRTTPLSPTLNPLRIVNSYNPRLISFSGISPSTKNNNKITPDPQFPDDGMM